MGLQTGTGSAGLSTGDIFWTSFGSFLSRGIWDFRYLASVPPVLISMHDYYLFCDLCHQMTPKPPSAPMEVFDVLVHIRQ